MNLAERAQAVLINCRDCGCDECIKLRTELILDLLRSMKEVMDNLRPWLVKE